eukprot:7390847-Prymnesium_polylepis.1
MREVALVPASALPLRRVPVSAETRSLALRLAIRCACGWRRRERTARGIGGHPPRAELRLVQ